MALDRNYIDMTSDSLIADAVDYYARRRDHERRFRSLYYQGRVYENANEYTKAILAYTEAAQLEDKVENDFAKGLLHAHLGSLYNIFYDWSKSLEEFNRAEDFYAKAGKVNHQYVAKVSEANILFSMDLDDEAEQILKETLCWGKDNNLKVSNSSRRLLADMYIANDRHSDYLELFSDMESMSPGPSYYYVLACRYALENNAAGALSCLDSMWNTVRTFSDTVNAYNHSYRVHKLLNNHKEALAEYEKLFYVQDTTVRAALQQPLLTIQRDYFQSQAENNALKLINNRMILRSWIIIAISIIVVVILCYRHLLLEKQRKLDDYVSLHNELEIMLEDSSDMMEAKDYVIRSLFSHQYELLDELCRISYEAPSTAKERESIYRKVKDAIEAFSLDTSSLAELEDFVNEYNNGVMLKLRNGMPMLTKMELRLLCFFYAGFSAKAISVFTGDSVNNIYVKKNRLKDRIMDEKPIGWQEILSFL